MKILIVANHWAVCSARYADEAFSRLGHDVRHIGPSKGRQIWGLEVPQKYVWTADGRSTWNEAEYSTLFGENMPDLVIVMDSDPSILDSQDAGRYHTPVVVWGVDNHVRDYRRPWFDHYFLAHRHQSLMKWDATYSDTAGMTHLPCAYDPVRFTPSPIRWDEREYDVCMIGVMYPQRWELVKALRGAGLKVLAGTGLVYDAFRDAYHNSRISLCASVNGDLGQRVFETAAMGCAILTDPLKDLEAEDTNAALGLMGYMVYEDVESCVSAAKELLSNEPIAYQVYNVEQPVLALAGGKGMGEYGAATMQAAVRDRHTWDARCKVVLDWYAKEHGDA